MNDEFDEPPEPEPKSQSYDEGPKSNVRIMTPRTLKELKLDC